MSNSENRDVSVNVLGDRERVRAIAGSMVGG